MFPQVGGRLGQTMNNHIGGGTGGSGGEGSGTGTGGGGGDGMGPNLSFDISTTNFTMNNLSNKLYGPGERGIDILHRAVASAALHDSVESFPQPKCHPETRTEMLNDLGEWATRSTTEPHITWLYGPAGAGKSAIMQTLARQLQDAKRLGGCFFFKRGHATCGSGRTLFATIAYQLALNVSWLKTPIGQIVEDDPSIVVRSIETQMERLIAEPCRPHADREVVNILIDGLDECEGHDIQEEILRVVWDSSSKCPIPLRFIVASRPEPHIRDVLDSPFYLHRAFNVEQSFNEVRKYLRYEFLRIHRKHRTMANILLPWPSRDVLEQLVHKSSGYFIYASTIINFIDEKNYRPTQRLAMIQNAKSTDSGSAFEALDQLYMTILISAPRQSELVPILCAIVNFDMDAGTVDQAFGLTEGEARLLLRGLHSVLQIPQYDDEKISSHHASFLDFLDNPSRSHNFCVGTFHRRIDLARSLLQFCVNHSQEPRELNMRGFRLINYSVIPFIASLPPSPEVAELFPLIGSLNPDYIFDHKPSDFEPGLGPMLSWFRLQFGSLDCGARWNRTKIFCRCRGAAACCGNVQRQSAELIISDWLPGQSR